MKLFQVSILLSLSIPIWLNANTLSIKELRDNKGLERISKKNQISKYLMMSFARVESGLNPFAVGVIESDSFKKKKFIMFLKLLKCNYRSKKGSSKISVYPENIKTAKKVLILLDYYDIKNYGIGISQLSRKNIEKLNVDRVRLFTDLEYSFKYSARILSDCLRVNKNMLMGTIECYYKGTRKSTYDYVYANKVKYAYREIQKELERMD